MKKRTVRKIVREELTGLTQALIAEVNEALSEEKPETLPREVALSFTFDDDDLVPRDIMLVDEDGDHIDDVELSTSGVVAQAMRAGALAERLRPSFQDRVDAWMAKTFEDDTAKNVRERALRFIEESIELVQALGLQPADVHRVAGYVFARAKGKPSQEVGGTMVTLAALCSAVSIDLAVSADWELSWIDTPEARKRIQDRQAEKRRVFGLTADHFDEEGQPDAVDRMAADLLAIAGGECGSKDE